MSVFERYLTVWVFLCIVVGIALGQLLPGPFQAIGRMEFARVNLPVGLLIWVMIIPMLLKVDFGSGNWGQVPMPPQTTLSDADATALAKWILSQAK